MEVVFIGDDDVAAQAARDFGDVFRVGGANLPVLLDQFA